MRNVLQTLQIPNSVLKYLMIEGPDPVYYVGLSVRLSVYLSVTPAVSGVRGADEQQKTKFGPTVDICTRALYARVVHNIINYNLFHPSISIGHYVAHGII